MRALPPGPNAVTGRILRPGERGYHGLLGDHPEEKQRWEQNIDAKAHNDEFTRSQHRSDARFGRQLTGLLAGSAAVGVGMGETQRAIQTRQNRKLRSQLAKGMSRAEPWMKVADEARGVHNVTILGETPKHPKPSNMARFGRWVTSNDNAPTIVAGGMTAGLLAGVPRAYGPAKENERLTTAVNRRKRQVAKGEKYVPTPEQKAAAEARRAAQQAEKEAKQHRPVGGKWTGRPISEHWRDHIHRGSVRNAAISTGVALGSLAALKAAQPKQPMAKLDRGDATRTALGATAGAATMDAVNTVGGQSAKAILKERRNRRGYSPHEEALWANHKKVVLGTPAGSAVPNDESVPQHLKGKLYRTMPKGLADRKANRLLAFKNTKGWTGGSLAGAAVVGGAIAHRNSVNKSLGDEARIYMSGPAQKIPRAAARAAKKGKKILSPEEIAQRRAEAAARATHAPPKAAPAPEPPKTPAVAATPPAKPRSSFLGDGQKRDLAIGVPMGLGLIAVGRHKGRQHESLAKRDNGAKTVTGLSAAGAVGAHLGEGHQIKRSERELHRVLSANNADVVGEHAQADRGIHGARAIEAMDNVRLLRGAKVGAAATGVLAASQIRRGKVRKLDNGQKARIGAGAVGGAALLDSADTLTGASLKRGATWQRDRAKARNTPETNAEHVKIFREHAKKHGLLDPSRPSRGAGAVPVDAPHAVKHKFYSSYPTALPGARLQRLNALRDKKTPFVLGAGAVLGGGYAARRQTRDVSKRSLVGFHHVGALTGAGTLGTAAVQARHHNDTETREALGAGLGGWAAQGAYQGAGYGYRNVVRGKGGSKVPMHERSGLPADADHFPDPAERALRQQNIKERAELKRHHPRKADQKRNTPPHWHGARMERRLGWTHGGKTGTALGTIVTLGGIAGGAELATRNDVHKGMTPDEVRAALAARKKNRLKLVQPEAPKPAADRSGVTNIRPSRLQGYVHKAYVPRFPVGLGPGRMGYQTGGRLPKEYRIAESNPVMTVRRHKLPDVPLSGPGFMRRKGHVHYPAAPIPGRGLIRAHNKASVERAPDIQLERGVMRSKSKRPTQLIPVVSRGAHGDISVGKSVTYGYMERRRSPYRTAELGAGVGVGTWGASRLNIGRQVDAGVRYATVKGKGKEAKAMVAHGKRITDATRELTGRAETGLRNRVPGFGTALDKIPAKMRPAAALGAGALLAARAVPTHDQRFVATGRW